MVIYGTFEGFKNVKNEPSKFKWGKIVNGIGESVDTVYLSEKEPIFNMTKLKFGNRFKIVCEDIINGKLFNISEIKQVNKNPICDVFRKFEDEYHMIKGKYKGKTNKDLSSFELKNYCIWLAKNTDNEATINNCLNILNKL